MRTFEAPYENSLMFANFKRIEKATMIHLSNITKNRLPFLATFTPINRTVQRAVRRYLSKRKIEYLGANEFTSRNAPHLHLTLYLHNIGDAKTVEEDIQKIIKRHSRKSKKFAFHFQQTKNLILSDGREFVDGWKYAIKSLSVANNQLFNMRNLRVPYYGKESNSKVVLKNISSDPDEWKSSIRNIEIANQQLAGMPTPKSGDINNFVNQGYDFKNRIENVNHFYGDQVLAYLNRYHQKWVDSQLDKARKINLAKSLNSMFEHYTLAPNRVQEIAGLIMNLCQYFEHKARLKYFGFRYILVSSRIERKKVNSVSKESKKIMNQLSKSIKILSVDDDTQLFSLTLKNVTKEQQSKITRILSANKSRYVGLVEFVRSKTVLKLQIVIKNKDIIDGKSKSLEKIKQLIGKTVLIEKGMSDFQDKLINNYNMLKEELIVKSRVRGYEDENTSLKYRDFTRTFISSRVPKEIEVKAS